MNIVGSFVAAGGILLALGTGGQAQLLAKRGNYGTRQACESARLLSPAECRNAFENALAELEEKTPRFKSSAECERHFNRCATARSGSGGRGETFVPALKGVEVVTRSGFDRIAVPVIENKPGSIQFSARNVTRLEGTRSPQKQAQAQKAWEASLVAARPSGQMEESFPDAAPPLEEAPPPVRSATPEEIERHRQRLRDAPLVR